MSNSVTDAIELLRKASTRNQVDKEIPLTVDAIATTLRLLNSTHLPANSKIFDKLVSTVREPFVRLYLAFPVEALQLSAAIFSSVFDEKIVFQFTAGDKALQGSWGRVADSLLSGVLDFLELQDDANAFEAVGSAMYPSLCRICFSPAFASSIATETTSLKGTAFMLLSDSAVHMTNRAKLRNPKLLGGQRIGSAFYASKEYVVIENLLFLISQLVSLSTSEAKAHRSSFINDIFTLQSPQGSECASQLVALFLPASRIESDSMLPRAFDILAASNILYPQPFIVDKIDACNVTFPQKPPNERLFVDYRSFFANIPEDDKYETLRIPFDTVLQMTIVSPSDLDISRVSIQTTTPPKLGAHFIEHLKDQSMLIVFEIPQNDIVRFTNALDARGLTEKIKYERSPRSQPRVSVGPTTRLVFGSDGSPLPDVPSYQKKITNIGQAMGLGNSSDDSLNAEERLTEQPAQLFGTPSRPLQRDNCPTIIPTRLRSKKDSTRKSDSKPYLTPSPTKKPKDELVPSTPSPIKIVQKSVFCCSDDGLSEISDADSLKVISQRQQCKNVSGPKAIEKTSVAVDVKRRRVIDLDDETASYHSGTSNATKARIAESDDDKDQGKQEVLTSPSKTSKLVDAAQKPRVQEHAGSGQIMRVPSPVESIAPVSSPIDQTDEGSDYEEPTEARVSVKAPKSSVKARCTTRQKQGPASLVSKKRKRAEDTTIQKKSDNLADEHKAKRLRSRPLKENKMLDEGRPTDSQILSKPPRTTANNYGKKVKKGRTSSPVVPVLHSAIDGNYDEVPIPPDHKEISLGKRSANVLDAGRSTSGVATRTRAAAMKNKKNELASTTVTKRTGARTAKAKAKHFDTSVPLMMASPPITSDAEEKMKQTETKAHPDTNVSEISEKKILFPSNIKPSQKQTVAPWEAVDFLKIVSAVSDPELDLATPVHEPPLTSANEAGVAEPAVDEDYQYPGADVSLSGMPTVAGDSHEQTLAVDESVKTVVNFSSKNTQLVSQPAAQPPLPFQRSVAVPQSSIAGSHVMEFKQNSKLLGNETDSGLASKTNISPYRKNKIMHSVSRPGRTETGDPGRLETAQKVDACSGIRAGPITIDLTLDDSPPSFRRFRSSPDRNHRVIADPAEKIKRPIVLDRHAQTPIPHAADKVTFSPVVKREVVYTNEFIGGTKNLFSMPRRKLSTGIDAETSYSYTRDVMEDGAGTREADSYYDGGDRNMQAIVKVLNEIQKVTIQKISGRYEKFEDVAMKRQNDLLQSAASDLQYMHKESVDHFNRFIDLETEYATRGRKLAEAYQENVDINREICQYIRQKTEEHDRNSLVKKMPKTLTGPLADIMQKYRRGH